MSKYVVLSYKPYDFVNNEGHRVSGARISYINRKPSTRENEFGYPPLTVTISDQNVLKDVKEVPGVYEMEFEQVTGKNNKPELILTTLEQVAAVDFSVFL